MREGLRDTLRAVLENATLRAILKPLDQSPINLSAPERAALLKPYLERLEEDLKMLEEVAKQYHLEKLREPPELEVEPLRRIVLDTKEGADE